MTIVNSGPMIGVAGKDGAGAIKLFKQHDAHQLMRPGGGAKGEPELGPFARLGARPSAPPMIKHTAARSSARHFAQQRRQAPRLSRLSPR